MSPYIPNRSCHCPRCRARGLMGPAILITLGVLFLLDQLLVVRWGESFPVFLIVIGVMLYLGRSASTEGHVNAVVPGAPVPPPPPADPTHPEVNR
ncbi:MAG TPA: hypothetical protein VKW06_16095 [Candidatus Angelobacter sp.]|nr:hypothetical protein [Candidatus Angelobacter sp.]